MSKLKEISLDKVQTNQYQPRDQFDEESLLELADSIRENGLIQPITVRQNRFGYEIIAGERRYRACKMLGYKQMPALIVDADDIESARLALVENIQREDLSPLEEANGYLKMLKLTGLTQQQLAASLGKSQSAIANKIRLLNLDESVQKAINDKQITERHGRALINLNHQQQQKMLDLILKKNFTVRQIEEYLQKQGLKKTAHKPRCFGVSERLIINSFRETYRKSRELSQAVTMEESEDEESYIMTIKVKKSQRFMVE